MAQEQFKRIHQGEDGKESPRYAAKQNPSSTPNGKQNKMRGSSGYCSAKEHKRDQ